MKYSIFLLFVVVSSCTTSSLYKEIDRQVEEVNRIDSNVIKWKGYWNPAKKAFKKLRGKLKESNHIIYIYIYIWQYAGMYPLDRTFYMALIYDVDQEKSYKIYVRDTKKGKMKIQPKDMDFMFEKFLLKNYLENKVDYLKSIQNNSTEWVDDFYGGYSYILDVKKNRKMKYVILEPIFFDENGNPL